MTTRPSLPSTKFVLVVQDEKRVKIQFMYVCTFVKMCGYKERKEKSCPNNMQTGQSEVVCISHKKI
jgi:hypothetical protein